ncbi:MAG: hypothetical protein ACRDSH_25900 [Pseudonocardiaceae bacterium]
MSRSRSPLPVRVDYRTPPGGSGWLATITAPDVPPRTMSGTNAHETLHSVLEQIAQLANQQSRPVLTVHTLYGSPTAFMEHAHQRGFLSCVLDGLLVTRVPAGDPSEPPGPLSARDIGRIGRPKWECPGDRHWSTASPVLRSHDVTSTPADAT